MDVWAEIRYLHASEGLSGRAIAKRLGVARKTVAKALASDGPPVYTPRPPVESAWARVEPAVQALLVEFPDMPATVLAQHGALHQFRQVFLPFRIVEYRFDQAEGVGISADHQPPPVVGTLVGESQFVA